MGLIIFWKFFPFIVSEALVLKRMFQKKIKNQKFIPPLMWSYSWACGDNVSVVTGVDEAIELV